MLKNHFSTSLGNRNSWRAFISNISPEAHENQLQVCHEFLQQHSFTLAFNSDCSRALLSASGKMNDCPSGKKKVFDTHTPQGQENGKKKCLKPAGAVQPPETQTWLFAKVQREDGSFHTYSNHNKCYFQHTLLNADTAFPLPHILPWSQFPSTSSLKWFMLFQPPLCLSSSARSLLPWTGKNNYIKRTATS